MLATPELMQELAQLARLDELLPRWQAVPLYAALVSQENFFHAPLITKQDIRREFPKNFLRPGQRLETLLDHKLVELEHTSGTSSERTPVIFANGWWNEQEARVLRLNAFVAKVLDEHPEARRATLVPPVCNGLVCFSNWAPPSARTSGSTLFVNQARIPFVLTDEDLARMAREISEWSPQFLDLDPVHGAWFALYCERNRLRFPSVKFILCSYEFVSVVHRRIVERVFQVPVFNLYGSTETGHLLMESTHGEMKPSFENVFYEVVDPDERGVGNLVVTTLTNEYMPLVRYRIGDLAQCDEGPYTTRYFVHGRVADALLRADGSRVTTLELDRCFAGVGGIAHYQFSLKESGEACLQFIPENVQPSRGDLSALKTNLETLFQCKSRIRLEAVKMLPPTPSGKFRLTRCH